MLNIDIFIAGYIAAVLFLTALYMLLGVNRFDKTDIIFTMERFVWAAFWAMITVVSVAEYRIHGIPLQVERGIMATTSTVVFGWTLYLYERNSRHIHFIIQSVRHHVRSFRRRKGHREPSVPKGR